MVCIIGLINDEHVDIVMTVVMMPVNGRGIAHCKDMIKFTNFYIIYIKNEKI